MRLAFCWAHCRRYVYDCHQAIQSPIAFEAMQQMSRLYAVVEQIRGRPLPKSARRPPGAKSPDRRRPAGPADSPARAVSGKSSPAEAICYALRHMDGLGRFLDDGRVELDSNVVVRSIRPLALGRKNTLFAGSDDGGRHWAIVASLINSAKLNGTEPLVWLTDALDCMVSGRTKAHELDRLLPWNWKTERMANARPCLNAVTVG